MYMSQAFNALPVEYVMDTIVITEAGAEHIDEFSAEQFGIDPWLEVEVKEGHYPQHATRRVPAWLITHEGCFVAAVVELTDYALLSR